MVENFCMDRKLYTQDRKCSRGSSYTGFCNSQSVSLALLAGALSADASGATPFDFFSSASALVLSIIIGFQRIGSGMAERQGPIAYSHSKNMLAPNPTFNHTPTCPNNDMSSQISCMKGMIGIMMLHSMYNSHAFQQSQR